MEALAGIRVVDFTRLYPGPLATAWLSDYGADVIKVEQPGIGDFSRVARPTYVQEGIYFQDVNRNKRSISVDLKSAEGVEAVKRLLKTADVLVESFRPGMLAKVGLGYEELKAEFPGLIYVSVSGFGHSGPYSHIAGHDLSVTGVGAAIDFRRVEDGSAPVIPPLPISDTHGAMLAVMGTLMAIVAKGKTGQGQHVDIALIDAMVAVSGPLVWPSFLTDKRDVSRDAIKTRSGVFARYNVYQARDGKWLTLGCLEPHLWAQFCKRAGHPEWIGRTEKLEDRLQDLQEGGAEMLAAVKAMFLTRDRDDWVSFFNEAGIAVMPANQPHDLLDDPHVIARGLVHTLQHPTEGPVKSLAVPAKLSGTPGSVKTPGPYLGEHTLEILSQLGYSQQQLESLVKAGVLAADARKSTASPGK